MAEVTILNSFANAISVPAASQYTFYQSGNYGSGNSGIKFSLDQRTAYWQPATQSANVGKFINFSFTADGFSVGIGGALQSIPQVAQVTAIIQGILGILGLFTNSANEPLPMPKVVTADAGISIGALIGATNGLQALINLLKGTVAAWKGAIQRAITSIQNLFKCLLKNPLLAIAIIARILKQAGVSLPPGLIAAIQAVRELLTKILSFTIDIALPLDILNWLKKLLSFKIPPFLLLPFIPDIPGCSSAFYSGRPPVAASYGTLLDPQQNTGTGGFSTTVYSTNIKPQYTVITNVGEAPTLALTTKLVNLSSYSPSDSGFFAPQSLNANLIAQSAGVLSPTNSVIRQTQDQLISSGNTFVNTVTAMSKDVSRIGITSRTSPLDDLLCAPNQVTNR